MGLPHMRSCQHLGNAMRIHCALKHSHVPAHSTRQPTEFIPHYHAVAGMPECALCHRRFYRWGNLKEHIRTGACEKLGGDAAVRYPSKTAAISAAPLGEEPTAGTQTDGQKPAVLCLGPENGLGRTMGPRRSVAPRPLFLTKDSESLPGWLAAEAARSEVPAENTTQPTLPLVLRPEFHRTLGSWGQNLAVPAFRRELAQFCVLCGMWIMDTKHIKQHYNKVHHDSKPDLRSRALQLCQPFKAQLRRDSNCRFCHTKVGTPGRHSQQCAVLFQWGLAVAYCQDGGFRCSADRGDLPSLFSQRGSTLSAPVSHTPASDGEQKAKAGAAPSWAAEDLGAASASVSLKPLPTGRVTPEPKPLTRGIHAHVPIDATSRGSAGIITRLIVFVKQDQHSVLPALYKASTAWHEKKDQNAQSENPSPLKTVLLSCVIRELLQRLQTVVATEESRNNLRKVGWINQDDHWVYQRWCAKTKKLILDPGRSPMSHDNAVRLLTQLRDGLKGDIIQKFGAAQPLYRLEEAGHQSATFFLEVSLRGQESHEVHRMLLDLVNNAMTHLVGISIKRETNQRSKLAQQLADMTFRGSGSQW